MKKLALAVATLLTTSTVNADLYHYRNQLIGERASGMGGAYIAISDDPTGIFYNPAGLVFGFENYISVSANTYTSTETRFKNIVGNYDYAQKSQALLPSFFGFSQSLGRAKFGFAVIVPESDLLNQDDELVGLSTTVDSAYSLRRRLFRQDTTYHLGPAYSMPLGKKASIGVSLMGVIRLDTAIDNQLIVYNPSPSGKSFIQQTQLSQDIFGFQPKLGFQYMPNATFSLGLTATKAFTVYSKALRRSLYTATDSNKKPVTPNGSFDHDYVTSEASFGPSLLSPLTIGSGVAYFPSKTLLFSGDFTYYMADTEFTEFESQSTFNASLGVEWYAQDSLAFRFGAFTNNANTAVPVAGRAKQAPHVNMLGGTVAVSMLKPGSSFTLGGSYAYGKGQGQAIDSGALQDVTQKSLSVYIAGGYQL